MAVVHPEHHSTLKTVHTAFLQAGSQAITTNSYGIVPGVGFTNAEERKRWLDLSGQLAREAADEFVLAETYKPPGPLVFGSLGPLVESYRPDLILPHDEGVQNYQIACQALEPHVDALLEETMSCVEEAVQAIEGVGNVLQNETKPMLVSFTLDSHGNLRDGKSVIKAIVEIARAAEKFEFLNFLGIMFNCAEPESITLALAKIRADESCCHLLKNGNFLLGAYANRLTPVDSTWSMAESQVAQPFRNDLSTERYWNDFIKVWVDEDVGVQLIGGCCGITPEHIAYLGEQLHGRLV